MTRVGDRVRLNFLGRQFDIQKYIDGDMLYSFKNLQPNIPNQPDGIEIKNCEFLSHCIPILLSSYEEELLEIRHKDGGMIGYTKSFKIDLSKAIEEEEIILKNLAGNDQTVRDQKFAEEFIQNILDYNLCYAYGLMTESERKSLIENSLQTYIENTFKEELQQIREENTSVSDQEFFSNSWKRYLARTDYVKTETAFKNISIIWTYPPTKFAWYHQFVQECIINGLDKKTYTWLSFSGLHVSNERPVNPTGNESSFIVTSDTQRSTDELHYRITFINEKREEQEIETEDIWENKEFKKILKRIMNGPVS